MASRKPLARNNHLEEAMALLIRNQAAFVEQIARNDQERLALKEWQHKTEVWQHKTEDWQRKAEDRFDKIEERLSRIEASLVELPKNLLQTILEQIPKIRKEIGFTPPT
jgi:oligoendopeptidase F